MEHSAPFVGRDLELARLGAVLAEVPAYVHAEVGRLVPRLGEPEQVHDAPDAPDAEWRRERMFTALGELLTEIARRGTVTLLVEDIHWADDATLDCLTYLVHATDGPSYVVTCRSDEASLEPVVLAWLNHARRQPDVEEIRLAALSADDVAQQASAILGTPAPAMRACADRRVRQGKPGRPCTADRPGCGGAPRRLA